MICATQQPVSGSKGLERSSRNVKSLLASLRAPQHRVLGAVQFSACDCRSSGSSVSSRPSVRCRAEPEPVSGYTPADYISFSTDENKQCHHNAEVWVDAPMDVCYSMWSEWTKLLDFLDLVGQIGLDNGNPNMALFQCFYRFRKLPLMEIVFLLEREEEEQEDYRAIHFKSVYGMPIKGQVQLSEQLNGQTRVRLYFTHPVPTLLVQLQIGPFGVETDLKTILQENLAAFKQQAEAAAPADWEQQKPQVIAKVEKVVEDLQIVSMAEVRRREQEEREQQQQQEAQGQDQQQQQDGASQPQQQQEVQHQPQAQQLSGPADPQQQQQQQQGAAQTRPRGRSTASKASAAAEAGSAPAHAAAEAAEPATQQAGSQGRKTARGRSASKTAAGAVDSSSATKRRSRMSSSAAAEAADTSSSNGTGPAPSSSSSNTGSKGTGRRSTARRTSKRPSTAAKE